MPLAAGEYQGLDSGRRVGRFTMRNGDRQERFEVSFEAMDDFERTNTAERDRDGQFERLRDPIQAAAERRFFAFLDSDRPTVILLRTGDF
jgi:hypothetical protein